MKQKLPSLICIIALLSCSLLLTGCGGEVSYEDVKGKTESYIIETLTNPGYGDEWKVLGLARADAEVDQSFYESYVSNLETVLKDTQGELSPRKYTEYSRVILALSAVGENPEDIAGYNLLEKLADFEGVKSQGINGSMWALIALDSCDYEIPQVSGVKTQTTRELLIEDILSKEIDGGGFALSGSTPDCDLTAMAVQALAPYVEKDEEVKAAVTRAIDALSAMQAGDGYFSSYDMISAESLCQVIVALATMGIDPEEDERFVKGDVSPVDALFTFSNEDGGFCHTFDEGDNVKEADSLATEQGYYALTAYDRLLNGQSSLYDMK